MTERIKKARPSVAVVMGAVALLGAACGGSPSDGADVVAYKNSRTGLTGLALS